MDALVLLDRENMMNFLSFWANALDQASPSGGSPVFGQMVVAASGTWETMARADRLNGLLTMR